MEISTGDSEPRRHSKPGSSGRVLPRRSTRGPLDVGDSPLSAEKPQLPSQPLTISHQPSSLLSTTSSQYATPPARSPRLPSPNTGSNLSAMSGTTSFRTAQSSNSPTGSHTLSKDFSFLLRPEIYHPLTHLDIPPPFRSLSLQPTPDTPLPDLVSSGHFRSAAIKAAQLLTTPGSLSPTDHARIFSLVYTRLSCLTLCNQTSLAAQEVKALEDLNSTYYSDPETDEHLVPWELRVLAVRLQGMGFNDARRGVMGYYDLAREARLTLSALKKTNKDTSLIAMWESRLSELGVRVASALVEMEDFEGAARFLLTLKPEPSSRLQFQKALLWLCLGDVTAARSCIAASGVEDETKVILALAHMADSEYALAVAVWEELIAGSVGEAEAGDKAMCQQNLGVCLLYLGRMAEAREILESLVEAQNSFHALTFNLTTIYELCTEKSRTLKIGLAEKVAGMMEEGVERRVVGSEKVNGDFKL